MTGSDVGVYHAGTAGDDGKIGASGGPGLGRGGTHPPLGRALEKAYAASEQIHFDKLHKRADIGRRALNALKGE